MDVAALYAFYLFHLGKPVSYFYISCSRHRDLHVKDARYMFNDDTVKLPMLG